MFTGGFSSISNSVSDSKPASVSGSGSGADSGSGSGSGIDSVSGSGSGSGTDSGSGSGSGSDLGSDSSVSLGLERRLVLGVDGVHIPSSWGIGEEVRDGDLALFIF